MTCTISRNGDLINHIYLQVQFPALSTQSVDWGVDGGSNNVAYTNSLGHALIRSVDIEIGGQRIDRQYGIWLEVWDELTQTSEKQNGYNHMIGKSIFAVKSNIFQTCGFSLKENIKIPHIILKT